MRLIQEVNNEKLHKLKGRLICRPLTFGGVILKNILVIMTGGTIVSTDSGNGLEPNTDNFIKKYTDNWNCKVDFICPFNVDSSQISPKNWESIGKLIDEKHCEYNGVLVTHGTDTLAYSSTALSLMLENLNIPVVFTGSQIPLNDVNSDAPGNLEMSRKILLESRLKGVFVAFAGQIMWGDSCSKTKSEDLSAFESINCDYVQLNDVTEVNGDYQFNRLTFKDKVFLLKAFPGIDPKIFKSLYEAGYSRFVIEAFGKGSLPESFAPEIKNIVRMGGKVGIVTQCRYNGSECYKYKAGREMIEAGAFDYGTHTTEYALVHMMLQN